MYTAGCGCVQLCHLCAGQETKLLNQNTKAEAQNNELKVGKMPHRAAEFLDSTVCRVALK